MAALIPMEHKKVEYQQFITHYSKLCDTLTDVNDLLPYFVEEKIISVNDHQEINAIVSLKKKVEKLMEYIAGPLQHGNVEGFFIMLEIMENHGNKATQQLAEQIKGEISTAVMVTGITGEGKSTTGNFLLGRKLFKVGGGILAVTSKSGSHSAVVNGRGLKIIDTPGFCEDSKDDAKNMQELGKAIVLARNGVHGIALVVNASHRFTSSQVTLLKELDLLDDMWPFMFIIFTAARTYGDTEKDQRDQVNEIYRSPSCPADFKSLLDKVGHRFMMLECTETDEEYKATKLQEFFTMIDEIYSRNQRLYSNKLFKKALKLYQEQKDSVKNAEIAQQQAIKSMNETIESMRREQQRQLELMQNAQRENQALRREVRHLKRKNSGGCHLM